MTENTIASNDSNGMLAALAERLGGGESTTPAEVQTTTPVETAPEITKPAAVEAIKEATPLKKGFDALEEEPEAPKETPKEADDTPADAKTPEARNAWSAIKSEAKTLREEKSRLEAEKAELTAKLEAASKISDLDPVKAEAEALRKRVEELEPVVARSEYRKSSAYINSVEKPMQEIGENASALAKVYELPESKIVDALRETDIKRQNEMLDELTENMSGRDKARLYSMADRLEQLYRLDDQLSANASQALKEATALEAQQVEKTKNERRAAEMRAVHDSGDKLRKAVSLFKLDGESDDAAVKAVLDEANAVPFDEQDVETKAFSVIAANLVPRMQRTIRASQARIKALEAEISGLASASPRTAEGETIHNAGEEAPADMMTALTQRMRASGMMA